MMDSNRVVCLVGLLRQNIRWRHGTEENHLPNRNDVTQKIKSFFIWQQISGLHILGDAMQFSSYSL